MISKKCWDTSLGENYPEQSEIHNSEVISQQASDQ